MGHPNIVRLLDAGSDAHGPFMVLELLVGETLCDVLDRRPLGPREALTVMAATLDALQAAHSAGVVHRDIKPENIFLVGGIDRCTGIKLLDFGISKIISMQSATGGITRVGTAVGTPDYMSPEQAGGGRVDGRADLWSVGAVLYEAISLEHPFEGDSYQQLISNIVLHPHLPLRARVPAAPAEVEAFIDRALRKEPADRYTSAAEMLAVARRLVAALPSDESLGFRHDEPTSVMRAAPSEPTQVIEVRPSAAAAAATRPQRGSRQAKPPAHAPPSRPPPAPAAHPTSLPGPPMPGWTPTPDGDTLVNAPAHAASRMLAPAAEVGGVPRSAITIAAVIAGVLVAGALALRIRAATQYNGEPIAIDTPPAAVPHAATPPPSQQVLVPNAQPLTPTAQALAPSPTQALVPSPAAQVLVPSPTTQVLAPPPATQVLAPPPAAPTPRATEHPTVAPRRSAPTPLPRVAPGGTDSRMAVLRMALPALRSCAAGPPRYVGNVDAVVYFDARGHVRSAQVRTPSRMTVHGACISRALMQLVVPAAASSAVPMFQTFN